MRRRSLPGVVLALAVLGGCASPRPFTPVLGRELPVPIVVPAPVQATAPGGVVVSVPGTAPPPAALPRAALPRPDRGPALPEPSAPARVEGIVESVSAETAVLRIAADRTVLVDFSAMTLPAPPALAPGRSVAVWGEWSPTALLARGVAFDYGDR